MPEYRLQRFRGGWAIAEYENGKRISRRGLESSDAAGAAAEFNRLVEEAERPVDPDIRTIWERYVAAKEGRRIAENMAKIAFWDRRKIPEVLAGSLEPVPPQSDS